MFAATRQVTFALETLSSTFALVSERVGDKRNEQIDFFLFSRIEFRLLTRSPEAFAQDAWLPARMTIDGVNQKRNQMTIPERGANHVGRETITDAGCDSGGRRLGSLRSRPMIRL